MIDIPLSLRVPPQGRYNRGIYTCYHYCPVKAGKSVFEIVET